MNRIPELMAAIAAYAERVGVTNIDQLPGCWEFTAGEFDFAVNGHDEQMLDSLNYLVAPRGVVVRWKGGAWVVLDVSMSGGFALADAEDAVIAALSL